MHSFYHNLIYIFMCSNVPFGYFLQMPVQMYGLSKKIFMNMLNNFFMNILNISFI